MPTEIRDIIFTTNEVVPAVRDFRLHKRDPMPSGSVLACDIFDRPQAHAAPGPRGQIAAPAQ